MSVYLTLGKSKNGELLDIASQGSGKCGLVCPFCDVSLIAVKGIIKQHHFRHDGETCNESLNELPVIEGWDHFHLSVPQALVELLHKKYKPESKSPNFYGFDGHSELEKYNLITKHEWSGQYEFTDNALVILGVLPLPRFNKWMRTTLQSRFDDISTQVSNGYKHKAHRDIEAYRQQTILNASLYLFEYQKSDGEVFYKVGRTKRDVSIRLKETLVDIRNALDISVKGNVLRQVPHAGYVEQFTLYKYKKFKMPIADHHEYLMLDAKAAKHIKAEFTRLLKAVEPFNKVERFITSGRWQYEDKRIEAVKKGIAQTLNSGSAFGRPKGSILSEEQLLAKYPQVVKLLESGLSTNLTAERTGVSRSTVKRVRAKLVSIGDSERL